MPVAVEGNLVPGRGDLGGELGQTLDLLADEKEGRPQPIATRSGGQTAAAPGSQ